VSLRFAVASEQDSDGIRNIDEERHYA
jgi:hypothetical protein